MRVSVPTLRFGSPPYSALLPVFLVLTLLPTSACAQQAGATPDIALTNISIVDVGSASIQPGATVLIGDGRILEITSAAGAVPEGVEVFDGTGKFVIPGLWDMHVHLSMATESALPVLLANGVTGVRDLGGDLGEIDRWRAQIDAGTRAGPRIVRAGPMLNGESFNEFQLPTEGPAQSQGIVRALDQVGVDFIKVHRRVPRDDYFAIVEQANALELPVVGHVPMTVTPAEASDAGQLIEHTETLFEGTFGGALSPLDLPDSIRGFRSPGGGAAALFSRFARNGTPVTPVLGAWQYLIEHPDTSALAEPHIRYVARSLRESARESPLISSEQVPVVERLHAEYREVVRLMHDAGITLIAGTDLASAWQIPGFSLHDELAALVDAGLTPAEALRSATSDPAQVLRRESDFGVVETGRLADLVILGADPLQDIAAARSIDAVVFRGRLLGRAELDALLRRGEALANLN